MEIEWNQAAVSEEERTARGKYQRTRAPKSIRGAVQNSPPFASCAWRAQSLSKQVPREEEWWHAQPMRSDV